MGAQAFDQLAGGIGEGAPCGGIEAVGAPGARPLGHRSRQRQQGFVIGAEMGADLVFARVAQEREQRLFLEGEMRADLVVDGLGGAAEQRARAWRGAVGGLAPGFRQQAVEIVQQGGGGAVVVVEHPNRAAAEIRHGGLLKPYLSTVLLK